jgi:arylsulfatase A-like enzyme
VHTKFLNRQERPKEIQVVEKTDKTKKKPNILFIMGDDIGWYNISAYNLGLMGYRTPNIDSIAKQGALFTDWYGQQSCTAGRAAFLTGQSPIRTGLTKVGLPGADIGLRHEDLCIAEVLKSYGYATGQFGKNHLGDRNEFLPTVHGFDEFFGNLYHLNAEEEPENVDYPKDPKFKQRFGPRGVLRCRATEKEDSTIDPQYGKVGKQVIENTGALNTKRMETVDEEFLGAAKDFITRQQQDDKPWFCYFNPTRMHVWTHLKKESIGKTGLGTYPDGMVETDGHVGELLQLLKDLKVDDNTIVVYTTDNGAEPLTWPDGGATPFKGEKDTNWEGGFRVPCVIRWPGVIEAGSIINDICSHYDFLPTFAAAAGDTDVVERVKKGTRIGEKSFKVHLDGDNLLPFFKGEVKESPREGFVYWSDDGDLLAIRVRHWKVSFMEQENVGMDIWERPFSDRRVPRLYNLRSDPFERGPESVFYNKWKLDRIFVIIPAQALAMKWLESFKEYPPRQKPATYSLTAVIERMAPYSTKTESNAEESPQKQTRPSTSKDDDHPVAEH